MAFKKVQSKAVKLYSGIGAGDTEMRVTPFPVDLDGNKLTMAAFGATPQVTVDPKILNSEEIIGFTDLIDNGDGSGTYVGLIRDLASSSLATPGTGKPHGAGAKVVISWNPQDVARVAALENDNTFEGINIFEQVPQSEADPILPNDLTRLSFVQALVLGTLTTIDVIVPGKAGTTIAAGKLIYFDDPTNRWLLCDADFPATVNNVLLGIAQGAGTSGNAITGGVLLQGLDTHQTGLSEGQTYYASNTAGGISSTPGTTTVAVGIGSSVATNLYFAPRFNQQLTQDQFNALAGTFGTPSGTNKYVTDADTTGTGRIPRASAIPSVKFGGTGADGAFAIGDTLRTGTVTSVGTAVVGVGTLFLTQIAVGDTLVTGSGVAVVSAIADDTHLTLAGSVSGGDVSAVPYSQGLLQTIDVGAVRVFVKNYTTFSITGHARLNFINPNGNGTTVVIKTQGNMTLTSATTPMLDCSGMGAVPPAAVSNSDNPFTNNTNGTTGNDGYGVVYKTKGGGAGVNSAPPGGVVSVLNNIVPTFVSKYVFVTPGSSGGGGQAGGQAVNSTTGHGGRGGWGGGALVLEVGGAINFTTTSGISVAATDGTDGTLTGGTAGCAGGGGGGSGGWFFLIYNTLTSVSGTVTLSGGIGGKSPSHMIQNASGGGGGGSFDTAGSPGLYNSVTSTKDGGDGAPGSSLVIANTEFV